MQLFSRNKALVALSLSALTVLGACGDDVTVTETTPPETVTVSPANLSLNVGEVGTLAVQVSGPATAALTTCTASSAVITVAVNAGACRVTAVAPGNATVTATSTGGKSASASVTVNQLTAAISGISVSPAAANLTVGGTTTITATPTTQATGASIARAFVTSNAAVATVNATTGVVTAVAPGSATITVTLTGTGTGLATATVTGSMTVNVTALPAGITGISVTAPAGAAATMTTGGTQQITANVTQPTGAAAATLTYTTADAGVAQVSSAGVITAVGPGRTTITVTATSAANASFSQTTLSTPVQVTVNNPANVTIGAVTQGPVKSSVNSGQQESSNNGIIFAANAAAGQIVDQLNVRDQINVSLNLEPNNNAVSSVRVYVCDNAGANCGAPAAEQTFANNVANSSIVTLLVNTADFTANFATGTASTLYKNGQRTIKASVRTPDGQERFSAINNSYILNFNNIDGWAVSFTAPARVKQSTNTGLTNLNWHGGPGTDGSGSYTVVPVFYNNRAIRSFLSDMSEAGSNTSCNAWASGAGTTASPFVSSSEVIFPAGAALPYSVVYGKTIAGGALRTLYCDGYFHGSGDRSNFPNITSAIDDQNNSAPTVVFATGFRTSVTVPGVTPIRLDYANPTGTVAAPSTQWANASYNFASSTNLVWSDNLVGKSSTVTPSFTYTGCGATAAAMATGTGADIPECATDFTPTVYTATVTMTDELGNVGTATTGAFGVDKTAPVLRFSNTSVGADTIFATTGWTNTLYQPEAIDERSGLNTWTHQLATANQANPTGVCVVGTTPTAGIGSAFITAPNCNFATASSTFGSTLGDGYRVLTALAGNTANLPATGQTIAGTEGYYTYRARVTDRAGNTSTSDFRRILVNYGTPLIGGIGLPATLTAGGANTFTPSFAEMVEASITNFRVSYTGFATPTVPAPALNVDPYFTFPGTSVSNRFDDAILLNGNVGLSTPFTAGTRFYTDVETVPGSGIITTSGASTSFRPDTVGARIYNGARIGSAFFVTGLLAPNVETDTVSWKTKLALGAATTNTWALGSNIAQFNAPADGLKAVFTGISCGVLANCQVNPPFARVDYYEFGNNSWRYVGSVDKASAINADNGVNRFWTYRLPTSTVVTDTVGATTTLGTPDGRQFIAVGTFGAATTASPKFGRVLASAASSATYANPFALASVTASASAATITGAGTSTVTITATPTSGSPSISYSCSVSANLAPYISIAPSGNTCVLTGVGTPGASIVGQILVSATGSGTGFTTNTVSATPIALTRNP